MALISSSQSRPRQRQFFEVSRVRKLAGSAVAPAESIRRTQCQEWHLQIPFHTDEHRKEPSPTTSNLLHPATRPRHRHNGIQQTHLRMFDPTTPRDMRYGRSTENMCERNRECGLMGYSLNSAAGCHTTPRATRSASSRRQVVNSDTCTSRRRELRQNVVTVESSLQV